MTSTISRSRRHRGAGRGASRLVLALAVLTGALAIAVARPEPASAFSVRHGTDEIVITSERLEDEHVRVTLIVTLRRDGDMILRADQVHNSGATRKFIKANATVTSPATGVTIDVHMPANWGSHRIASDATRSWEERTYSQGLFDKFDQVYAHQLDAVLRFDADRSSVQ
jgi:hypothetical protein